MKNKTPNWTLDKIRVVLPPKLFCILCGMSYVCKSNSKHYPSKNSIPKIASDILQLIQLTYFFAREIV